MSNDAQTDGPGRGGRSILRRRRENSPGGRERRIVVKVTADEDVLLRSLAQVERVSVQRLMINRATAVNRTPAVDYETRRAAFFAACEVRNLVAAIGNNMNQIARQANTDEELPEDFPAAVDAVKRTLHRVMDAFEAAFGFEGRAQ